MRHVVIILAFGLILFPAASRAQEFCATLDRLVQMAPSEFRSILGRYDDGYYEVSEWIPGADDCWVDEKTDAYWCTWGVGESLQLAHYGDMYLASMDCYPSWEDSGDAGYVVLRGDNAEIYITYDEGYVDISIDAR